MRDLSRLLKYEDREDGFPIGMRLVVQKHPDIPSMVGDLCVAVEKPYHSFVCKKTGDTPHTQYYGQKVRQHNGDMTAFIALSWLRPATADEIREAGL